MRSDNPVLQQPNKSTHGNDADIWRDGRGLLDERKEWGRENKDGKVAEICKWQRHNNRWWLTLWPWTRIFHFDPCPEDGLTCESWSASLQSRSWLDIQSGVVDENVQASFAGGKFLSSRLDLLQVSKISYECSKVFLLNRRRCLQDGVNSTLCLVFAPCANIDLCALQSELMRRVPTNTSGGAKQNLQLGRESKERSDS